jgi:hypothetical protein
MALTQVEKDRLAALKAKGLKAQPALTDAEKAELAALTKKEAA